MKMSNSPLMARIALIAQILVLFKSTVVKASMIPTIGSRQGIEAPLIDVNNSKSLRFEIIDNDPNKLVGVCDENSVCDDLEFEWPSQQHQALVITSSIAGKRFSVSPLVINSRKQDREEESLFNEILDGQQSARATAIRIHVDLANKLQPIMGWGGAFTDATCYNIARVDQILGDKMIASYYGPKGLRYNFGRVPIAGSDFSMRPYSYDDNNEKDLDLKEWSLANEDLEYKIPVIQKAIQMTGKSNLKLFASPWSAPAWMKSSKNLIRGHLLANDTIYQVYANYLIKFFEAYRDDGIEFWGATVQNEPVTAYYPFYFFNSLQFSSTEMSKFVGKFYGPALVASGRTKEKFKLIIGDDSLGLLNFQVPSVMQNQEAAQYISGLAFHWYTSGVIVSYNKLNELYDQIGKQIEFVMMSEACTGSKPTSRGPRLGDWSRGEAYASDIIEDLKRHTNSWIDWNMVLDLEGGPNWAKNFVDSPIIVDVDKKVFYKQPMYYALAHFTTLFPADCRVLQPIASESASGLSFIGCHIESTNHVVINVLNQSKQQQSMVISIDKDTKTPRVEVEPRSLTSFIFKL